MTLTAPDGFDVTVAQNKTKKAHPFFPKKKKKNYTSTKNIKKNFDFIKIFLLGFFRARGWEEELGGLDFSTPNWLSLSWI